MSLFKRITHTLSSRLDQVVSEIENHDAVIQATLTEMQKKLSEAKIRLRHVHDEQRSITKQIQEHQTQTERWRTRALSCAEEDEEKALQCVKRANASEQAKKKLSQLLKEYDRTTEKLARDVQAGEQQIAELKQKHKIMRARESTSQVLDSCETLTHFSKDDLQHSFDRWEVEIGRIEMASDSLNASDCLEDDFIASEQRSELQAELAQLRKKGDVS